MKDKDYKKIFKVESLKQFLTFFEQGKVDKSLYCFFEMCTNEREKVNPHARKKYSDIPNKNSSYKHWVAFYNFTLRRCHWDDIGFFRDYNDGWYYKIFLELIEKINTK